MGMIDVFFEFIEKHKIFIGSMLTIMIAYYLIIYLVYLKPNKIENDSTAVENINESKKELNDVPVVADEIEPVADTNIEEKQWMIDLKKMNMETDRLENNEKLDNLLDDTGIDRS